MNRFIHRLCRTPLKIFSLLILLFSLCFASHLNKHLSLAYRSIQMYCFKFFCSDIVNFVRFNI